MTPTNGRRPIRKDAFPTTQRTWLGDRLGRGTAGLGDANRHVMTVYATPLAVYFKGSTFRWMGDADDMVRGFFADRLSRELYLSKWLSSERPLRFWLIVGFKHYLLEQSRKMRRDKPGPDVPDDVRSGPDPAEEAFSREYARSIVGEALRRGSERCDQAGQSTHWQVFLRHYLDGIDYAHISAELGVTPQRGAVMARTASGKFKAALRELVGWAEATPDEVDAEIRSLMETRE